MNIDGKGYDFKYGWQQEKIEFAAGNAHGDDKCECQSYNQSDAI